MPLYEYRCESCSHVSEVLQKLSDPAPEACPKCGNGPMVKLMSSNSFSLKGSGWYVTDYKKSSGSGSSGKSSES